MICHYAVCRYAECRILLMIMLNVVMLNVIMLSVVTPIQTLLKVMPLRVLKVQGMFQNYISLNRKKLLFHSFILPCDLNVPWRGQWKSTMPYLQLKYLLTSYVFKFLVTLKRLRLHLFQHDLHFNFCLFFPTFYRQIFAFSPFLLYYGGLYILTREPLLKGKAQYSGPPCAN